MIVLDASLLIAHLDAADDNHASASALVEAAADDTLAANPLTLAEVLVGPARAGRLDEMQAALRDLEVEEVPFPADTSVRLARLRADTGLKLPDCCVLLAAEQRGAAVASLDVRLCRAAEVRGLAVHTVQPGPAV